LLMSDEQPYACSQTESMLAGKADTFVTGINRRITLIDFMGRWHISPTNS